MISAILQQSLTEKSWFDIRSQKRTPGTTQMRLFKRRWPWNWWESKIGHETLSCHDTFLTETQRSDLIIEFDRIINNQIIKFIFKTLSFKKKSKSSNDDTVRNWTTSLSTRFESVSSQRDTIPYEFELLRTNSTELGHAVWFIRYGIITKSLLYQKLWIYQIILGEKEFFKEP